MKLPKLSFVLIFMLPLLACEKLIDITPKSDFTGQLFIESILFPGKEPKVFVSRSLPFFDASVTPQQLFARGAVVTISGISGMEVLSADSTFDKFRCRWTPYYQGTQPSNYGETYDLTVTFENKTYTASTTIDQPKVIIETVEYVAEFFDIYGGHDGVIITFDDAPGPGNYYRYQMNRMIDNTFHHVDVLEVIVNDCTDPGERYPVTDLGRTIFSDENVDGQSLKLFIEVSFEYVKDDSTWVFLQSMDRISAEFYQQLDEQLLARVNPFVEPVFLDTKIEGAIGVFGSAVLSDSVLFIYPVSSD